MINGIRGYDAMPENKMRIVGGVLVKLEIEVINFSINFVIFPLCDETSQTDCKVRVASLEESLRFIIWMRECSVRPNCLRQTRGTVGQCTVNTYTRQARSIIISR